MKKLTARQRARAEEALVVVPHAIRAFSKAYPGITWKLAAIDAVSVANLAVVVAARTWDPKRSKATTYFSRAISNALLKAIEREHRHRPAGRVSLDVALGEATEDSSEDIAAVLLSLSEAQRQLVRARFYSKMTLAEIAEELGIDRRTVRRRLEEIKTLLVEASESSAP